MQPMDRFMCRIVMDPPTVCMAMRASTTLTMSPFRFQNNALSTALDAAAMTRRPADLEVSFDGLLCRMCILLFYQICKLCVVDFPRLLYIRI